MSNVAMVSNSCPKCGSELRVSWCAQCFGTGRSGKHKCKACGGKGTTTACPNVRSHKPKLFQIWTTFAQAARCPTSRRRSTASVGTQYRLRLLRK